MKTNILSVLLLIGSVGVVSAKDFNLEEKYKQNYMSQIWPSIEQSIKDQVGDKVTQAEIEGQAKEQAMRIASCQYDIMKNYPPKISELGILNIINGMGIRESNARISNELKAAISSGELDMQKFRTMMESNMAYMESCMQL